MDQQNSQSVPDKVKKPYEKPEVVKLGSVEELTQVTKGSGGGSQVTA